jgi:hypothetical protein
LPARRFPPPWSVDDPDTKLGQDCYLVRDANGHALAYVYFEDEPGRRSAAHLVTRGEARRIAVNIAAAARFGWSGGVSGSSLISLASPLDVQIGESLSFGLSGSHHPT